MTSIVVNRYVPPPQPSQTQSDSYSYSGYKPTDIVYDPIRQQLANPSTLEREVLQHGSIGEFITSSIEGVDSGFLRCIYRAKHDPEHTVTLLCEKIGGCCVTGCCPKDQFWMTGVIILLIFVLLVFCGGAIAIMFCYQRSKNFEKKTAERGYNRAESANSERALYNHDFRSQNKITPHSPYGDYTTNGRHTSQNMY